MTGFARSIEVWHMEHKCFLSYRLPFKRFPEASNSLRIAQAVEKLVVEHRDLKARSELHLRELAAARAKITEMGLMVMKGPITNNAEGEKRDEKAEAAVAASPNKDDPERKSPDKSKISAAAGGTLRFGVGSDTLTPRASLFESRDDYDFQENYNSPDIIYICEIGNVFSSFCSCDLVCVAP